MKKNKIREGYSAQVLSLNREYAGKFGEISRIIDNYVEIEVKNTEEIILVPVEHVIVYVQKRWRAVDDVEREGLLPE